MDGFEKMDLEKASSQNKKTTSTNFVSMRSKKRLKLGRKSYIALGVLGFVVLFVLFGIIIPGFAALNQAKKTYAVAKVAIASLKQQNVEDASTQLAAVRPELLKTQKSVQNMGYLNFVPLMNFYYSDVLHLTNASVYGLQAAQILVDSIKPYADVLGLKGAHSFVGGSAQDRIQTAVTTMSKVTPKIDEIGAQLNLVQKEIDQVNPGHYPALLGGQRVQDTLKGVRTGVDEATTFVNEAKPLIKVLPGLLGEPKETKYLVLFQNDKELRPTGGFITAYAIFRLEKGVIHVDSSSDIYNLDATIGNKPASPRIIQKYLPKEPLWNLRDTNMSPDFKQSMEDFNKLYVKAGGYVPVSGIIALDTHVLVAAMNILGDIDVDGGHFTTKEDPQCKCAQVIYAMEEYADTPVGYIKSNRKGIIGDLLYAIMQKAFASSPKLYWGPLFQTMINEINQKHIMFNLVDKDAQSGLESLNAAGRIVAFTGDYLHVNDSNFGGAKSNLFIKESVDTKYEVKGDGSVTKTVTLSYKNPFAPSDCNLEHGGLCLNAIQRDVVRVYVPKGSKLVSSTGSEVKVISYDELGKTVFEGFVTVRPLGAATYTISYELPFKVSSSNLPVLIQKQPGTDGIVYTVNVGNRQVDSFTLDTDKTLNLAVR
ncbi:MAG TPA: DUF4012 domain-containing protein [Candidatus Eisenbacteria bacterium]|nr:DUF4012 domain-containing protein [Candidatus Eisenbacteria bacterium]